MGWHGVVVVNDNPCLSTRPRGLVGVAPTIRVGQRPRQVPPSNGTKFPSVGGLLVQAIRPSGAMTGATRRPAAQSHLSNKFRASDVTGDSWYNDDNPETSARIAVAPSRTENARGHDTISLPPQSSGHESNVVLSFRNRITKTYRPTFAGKYWLRCLACCRYTTAG